MFDGLKDKLSGNSVFHQVFGPSNYGMIAGKLNPLVCCPESTAESKDGRDYRVFVDASHFGNVRLVAESAYLAFADFRLVHTLHRAHIASFVMPLLTETL